MKHDTGSSSEHRSRSSSCQWQSCTGASQQQFGAFTFRISLRKMTIAVYIHTNITISSSSSISSIPNTRNTHAICYMLQLVQIPWLCGTIGTAMTSSTSLRVRYHYFWCRRYRHRRIRFLFM